MSMWRKVFRCLIICLIGVVLLLIGLSIAFYYLLYLPMTTTETSRVNNIQYRVIGAELFDRNLNACGPATIILYIKNYRPGDLQLVGKVLNHFEIHESTVRRSTPVISELDKLMRCPSFSIRICNLNLLKYYECRPEFRSCRIEYKRINEDEFCLTSESGHKECFEFKWKPKK